jgi:BlaI family transcriptional regulator, penicillinase repressor
MAKKHARLPELSRLEQDIMNVVWDLGECSSAEVIAAYTKKRKLAKTTIRTVLANLRKKGYLEPVPSIERGFRLRAVVTRESVAKRSLKDVVSSLFNGSPQSAIAYLLKDEQLDESDLEEIRRMLDERKRGETPHERT